MMADRKRHIRQKFGRAAATYDTHAVVQLAVARQLASLLPPGNLVQTILEIGCGTGRFSRMLQEHYPTAQLTALDFAPQMVAVAQRKVNPDVVFHCLDAEVYLLKCQRQFSLITSNATMQWFADLRGSLAQIYRCLAPGGRVVFSIFGPASFSGLAKALAEVFQQAIVLPSHNFSTAPEIEAMVGDLFPQVEINRQYLTQRYDSFHELLVAIKTTGTGGYQQGLPALSRRKMALVEAWFAQRGGVKVEYEIFFVTLGKEE